MSAAAYGSLDPTNLGNFVNSLRLPGEDGLLGFLDASDAPVSLVPREERVGVLPGKETQMLLDLLKRLENTHSLIFGLPWGLKGAVGVGEALVVALAGGFVINS